ncbi:MAG: tRNA pseudouridine55 synthase [Solirubrobacteraceae bacterium]|nr:tRNA pseudouridine55 synthase [Solirubrobacteraceae bacterium]
MDGIILADKPAGKTSHDVVAAVRRELGRRRTGHAGTLDPFATGLLIVLVGRATRAQRFFMALRKTYRVVARLGAVSSTGDPEGEIVETGVLPPPDLELPTGELQQRPPAFSAVKVGGERAYQRARRGEEVDLAPRAVTVHRFEQRRREGDRAEFEIECSAGTYVRSLIADLGDAYCQELRRTAIGPFDVDDADGKTLIPLARALVFLPERRLGGEPALHASHGRAVPGQADGPVRLTDEDGVIAIAEPRGEELKPVVGFRGS